MTDPTVTTLQICFMAALGIFALTAIARSSRARRSSAEPPPLPTGRVASWPYLSLDLLWMGFIFITFFTLSISTASLTPANSEPAISANGLIQSILLQGVLAGMTVVVMVWRIRPAAWLGLRWPAWKQVLWIGPAGVAAMWLLSYVLFTVGYMQWMDSLGVESTQDSVKVLQTTRDPLVLALMAAAAVIVAPLCEEIVFRGYLYPAAKKFAGPWVAGACSALVFAAAHGSLAPLIPLFFFGGLLVLSYERTGSLWAPVAMHCCFNSATVVIQFLARCYDIPLTPNL
jgi:membrane protease YdiL (CAAX protease family)